MNSTERGMSEWFGARELSAMPQSLPLRRARTTGMNFVGMTIGEVAARIPQAAQLFERLHIDYCCDGGRSFEDACRIAGARPQEVLDKVARAAYKVADSAEEDWNLAPLDRLVYHLLEDHRRWVHDDLPAIDVLFERVAGVQGLREPSFLDPLQRAFSRLRAELEGHIRNEENVLFPAILKMERSGTTAGPSPRQPFGSVRNPITMMSRDLEMHGRLLDAMRELAYGYAPPEDACEALCLLFRNLHALEVALHTHMHLENNVLFPRAMGLER